MRRVKLPPPIFLVPKSHEAREAVCAEYWKDMGRRISSPEYRAAIDLFLKLTAAPTKEDE
jgi:hypothetical protein